MSAAPGQPAAQPSAPAASAPPPPAGDHDGDRDRDRDGDGDRAHHRPEMSNDELAVARAYPSPSGAFIPPPGNWSLLPVPPERKPSRRSPLASPQPEPIPTPSPSPPPQPAPAPRPRSAQVPPTDRPASARYASTPSSPRAGTSAPGKAGGSACPPPAHQAQAQAQAPAGAQARAPSGCTSRGSTPRGSTYADARVGLQVRDYAFSLADPRHRGERSVLRPEPGRGERIEECFESDSESDADADADPAPEEGEGAGVRLGEQEVLYAFEAESGDEISCAPGERVDVLGSLPGGWAIVAKTQGTQLARGLVPLSYLGCVGHDPRTEDAEQAEEAPAGPDDGP